MYHFSEIDSAVILGASVAAHGIRRGLKHTREERSQLERLCLMVKPAAYAASVVQLSSLLAEYVESIRVPEFTGDVHQIMRSYRRASGQKLQFELVASALRLLGGQEQDDTKQFATKKGAPPVDFPRSLFEEEE